jgi:tRNA pseudouridine38-40 synthase
MPRYKLTIEYDGTGLVGWQRQEGRLSVQQYIEEAINGLSQEDVTIFGAGRTDAGVHALGQVAHFDMNKELPIENIHRGLNFYLKDTKIRIIDVEEVNEEFHARFSAKKRKYLYRILNRKAPPAIRQKQVWHVPQSLDLDAMRKGAEFLIGNHDFTSFRAGACQAKSPVKTIDKIEIAEKDDEIHIHVEATSFLHHMIRNFVGTLHFVGLKKWPPEEVKKILEARDRTLAGPTAPAYGLYFVEVTY